MWLQGEVDIRGRDGESGTSKLTEAKTPLTWSSSPFEVIALPVYRHADHPECRECFWRCLATLWLEPAGECGIKI